jgi:hypothetical protein
VGKINSKTSKIIWSGSRSTLVRVRVKRGKIKVRLVKSFGQRVDTNELERESRVGKINSKTSKIIWSDSRYK